MCGGRPPQAELRVAAALPPVRGGAVREPEVFLLPEGYDFEADKGRQVVEHFLHYDEPPTHVRLELVSEGQLAAVARWET